METANASALLALAERVEAARGRAWELDALIRCAVFAPADAYVEQSRFNGAWCIYTPPFREGRQPRLWNAFESRGEFTASLDAALTLVPEGWEFVAGFEDGQAFAHVHLPGEYSDLIEAATPALALTAASLRALASTKDQTNGK